MQDRKYILAIDQGTSSTKTLIFDSLGQVVAKGTQPLDTHYFGECFVEQDPEGIYQNVLASVQRCIEAFKMDGGEAAAIQGCGISNQRETFVVWDSAGKPLYNAIVWQCKRSIGVCERLEKEGHQPTIMLKTGLLVDPYFSGTKLIWLYENVEPVRIAIDRGDAYFGTIDTWLLYRLTNGRQYSTDYTNASRTMFFNLSTLNWEMELLEVFGLSKLNLPVCKPSSNYFGETDFGGLLATPVSITAMIGDSHAAAFGEGCFEPGTAKATLGTGCSILMNVGDELKHSHNGMISTICWSTENKVQYALEGVIVTCGATIEWLKNELGLFADSRQTEAMATSETGNNGVYLVPAFSGLGAPHWDMTRKASITGLTFGCNKNHIVRAALESIPFQIKDVIEVMEESTSVHLRQLMIDGGISSNQFIVQFLADLLEKPVVNIGIPDVSALGAAYLSGLTCGVFESIEDLVQLSSDRKIYEPSLKTNVKADYQGWKAAIANR